MSDQPRRRHRRSIMRLRKPHAQTERTMFDRERDDMCATSTTYDIRKRRLTIVIVRPPRHIIHLVRPLHTVHTSPDVKLIADIDLKKFDSELN